MILIRSLTILYSGLTPHRFPVFSVMRDFPICFLCKMLQILFPVWLYTIPPQLPAVCVFRQTYAASYILRSALTLLTVHGLPVVRPDADPPLRDWSKLLLFPTPSFWYGSLFEKQRPASQSVQTMAALLLQYALIPMETALPLFLQNP